MYLPLTPTGPHFPPKTDRVFTCSLVYPALILCRLIRSIDELQRA